MARRCRRRCCCAGPARPRRPACIGCVPVPPPPHPPNPPIHPGGSTECRVLMLPAHRGRHPRISAEGHARTHTRRAHPGPIPAHPGTRTAGTGRIGAASSGPSRPPTLAKRPRVTYPHLAAVAAGRHCRWAGLSGPGPGLGPGPGESWVCSGGSTRRVTLACRAGPARQHQRLRPLPRRRRGRRRMHRPAESVCPRRRRRGRHRRGVRGGACGGGCGERRRGFSGV